MPRVNGVMQPLPNVYGTPGRPIESAKYNTQLDDLIADANAARPITAGGTGATDAPGARAALGMTIGTHVQAWDADLQALAGLVSGANLLPYFTGAAAAATTALTPFARSILDDADAATVRATIELNNVPNKTEAQMVASGAISTALAARLPLAGGSLSGPLTMAAANITMTRGAQQRLIHFDGTNMGFLGNDGNWDIRWTDTGALWTAEIGDLNTRIESRADALATARANSALTTARGEYANRLTNEGTQLLGLFLSGNDPTQLIARRTDGFDRRVITSHGNTLYAMNQGGDGTIECLTTNLGVRGISTFASDERMKDIHGPAADIGLETINRLSHIAFNYSQAQYGRTEILHEVGWSAQNLKAANETFVVQVGDYYAPNPTTIMPFMTKAIQELSAQVEVLAAKVAALESMVKPT